jgi:hypothetical protein
MMPQVLYTNSNCKDVWDMFLKQNKKHYNSEIYVITDTDNFEGVDNSKIFTYHNDEKYWDVWVRALKKFNLKNFIYLQEDFILYKNVNDIKITDITNFLNNSTYSFIRLIKSGNLKDKMIDDSLFEIESNNTDIFSMQPTIWKTEDYIKIMSGVKEEKWLENKNYRQFMIDNGIKGLYYFKDEPKRGLNHHDSSIYPYIATALVRGKWNISEYNNELSPLLEEYNINVNTRGIF